MATDVAGTLSEGEEDDPEKIDTLLPEITQRKQAQKSPSKPSPNILASNGHQFSPNTFSMRSLIMVMTLSSELAVMRTMSTFLFTE